MIRGITVEQVREALGLNADDDSVWLMDYPNAGIPKYEVEIEGDADISVHELNALVELFQTEHVCGKYTASFSDEPSSLVYEVTYV